MRLAGLFVILALSLRADDQVKQMAKRLAEEADAFSLVAPQLLSRETLDQRALKPPSRFVPRAGADALKAPEGKWQSKRIESEYAYSTLKNAPEAMHEFRQAVKVDGREVQKADKAIAALAKNLTSSDDERKRRMLREFEKLGLRGAVTDLGPMILLFTPREIVKYEFLLTGQRDLEGAPALVFSYKQVDGEDRMTVFEGNHAERMVRLRPSGEVWVSARDFVPLRITMKAVRNDGEFRFRDEMTVDYAMTPHGVVAPKRSAHKEWQGETLIAENTFSYAEFKRFGASSDIKFETEK